jgi:hypothetical protein
MAIKKTIEIDVNSQGANKNIDSLTNSIEQNTEATKTLKQQYKEAVLEVQRLSDEFGETSRQVTEAAKRAGELKDKIEDANDAIAAFKGEGAFNATAKALGSVASGFSAVEGSLALAGVQSENLQETMIRLQGAMALAQGLEGLEDAGRSFKQLGAVAKNALAGIRTGIAATGIGVLLVALGAVVAYWDDIKEAVGGVSSEQEDLNKLSQKNLDTEKGKLDSFSLQENSLRLQGKSEKDILNLKLAQTNQIIKASEIQIEQSIATTKAQTEAAKRNQDILAGVLKFVSLPLTMILKTVDAVGKALGKDFGLEDKVFKGLSSFVFDPKETQAEGDKVVAEQKKALEKLKSDRDGLKLSINNIDKQAAKDRQAKAKESNDKEIQAAKDRADALERIRQGEIDTEKERRAEELRQVQEQYKQLIAEAEKYYGENSAKVLSLKEAQRTKEKELQDKFDLEDAEKEKAKTLKEQEDLIAKLELDKEFQSETFEKQKEILTERENQLTNDKLLTDKQRTDLAKQYSDARINIDKAEQEAKEKNVQAVSNLLGNLAGVLGEATAAGKAAAVAQATISTFQSANQAYASLAGIPVVGPVLGGIAAGVAVASGIANVKKILAVKAPGASGGGGSVPSASQQAAAPTPQFNVVGNTGINQVAATLGQQQPVQAYVVANQVTSQQALDRSIVNNASLG